MSDAPHEAYPLTWPMRQRRTEPYRRQRSKFQVTLGQARDELVRELQLLGAKGVILSSNVPTRRDGLPYASSNEPADPGVAVYFDRKSGPFVIACDTYDRVTSNIRAIGVTVGALRAIQRHGASEMLEQAFTGFAALPPAGRTTPWWETLGVSQTATLDEIRKAVRELAAIHHPDRGGDASRMVEVNQAFERAIAARGAA